MTDKLITIGTLAQLAHCNVELIRYYESIELLLPTSRSEGGHRLYNQEAQQQLFFIRRARELGFSLEDIKTLLSYHDTPTIQCQPVSKVVHHHIDVIHQKIKDLKRIETELIKIAGRCEGKTIADCSVISALKK